MNTYKGYENAMIKPKCKGSFMHWTSDRISMLIWTSPEVT